MTVHLCICMTIGILRASQTEKDELVWCLVICGCVHSSPFVLISGVLVKQISQSSPWFGLDCGAAFWPYKLDSFWVKLNLIPDSKGRFVHQNQTTASLESPVSPTKFCSIKPLLQHIILASTGIHVSKLATYILGKRDSICILCQFHYFRRT